MSSIFHIGYHKTGSTYLQKHVFPRSTLKTYAGAELVDRITFPYAGDFDADRFRTDVLSRYGEEFLFSSENLIGDPLSGGCNGLAIIENVTRIVSAFPDAAIVVFVREQADVIQSMYAQYLKYGGTFSLPRLLHQNRNVAPFFCYEYYEYDRTIELLKKLIPDCQLFVYDYHELQADPESLLRRLNAELELGIEDFTEFPLDANVRMKRRTCQIVRRLNLLTAHHMKVKNFWLDLPYADKLIGRFRMLADRFMPLNPPMRPSDFWARGMRQEVIERYRPSNQRLRAATGIDLLRHVT